MKGHLARHAHRLVARFGPARSVLLLVLFLVLLGALSGSALAVSFSDVPPGHPYATAIADLAGRGVIGGFSDGTFKPDDPVTRQQFAKMIVKTLGLPVSVADTDPFTDVAANLDPNDPFYPAKYVAVVWERHITAGKTATTFAPFDHLTRAQLITLVARAANLTDPPATYTPPFPNFSPDHYPWARRAAYAGLLDGLQGLGQTFDFSHDASRAECAQLLHNLVPPSQPLLPTVTALNPTGQLTTAAGTPVTVTGTNFVAGATVAFGGTAATGVVVVSPTSITCLSPAHPAGVVDVTVTTTAGTSSTAGPGNDYSYTAAPTGNVWTNLNPSGPTPGPRSGQSMVFDSVIGKVIMFGGDSSNDYLNDTWAYDPTANTWTNLAPAGPLPKPRRYQTMAYDSAHDQIIMFGGFGQSGTGNDTNGYFYDTWAYDPTVNTWTQLHPSRVPPPRLGGSMAYDSAHSKVLMFGGFSPLDGVLFDTWSYDPSANTWTQLHPLTAPASRYNASMAYDSIEGKVILFGGLGNKTLYLSDTWAYDPTANTWTNLAPTGPVPAAREKQVMASVSTLTGEKMIMFGGLNSSDSAMSDTWSYDPTTNSWADLAPAGPVPVARDLHSMASDTIHHKIILFGGEAPVLGDTWSYTPLP